MLGIKVSPSFPGVVGAANFRCFPRAPLSWAPGLDSCFKKARVDQKHVKSFLLYSMNWHQLTVSRIRHALEFGWRAALEHNFLISRIVSSNLHVVNIAECSSSKLVSKYLLGERVMGVVI